MEDESAPILPEVEDGLLLPAPSQIKKRLKILTLMLGVFAVTSLVAFWYVQNLNRPPQGFPVNQPVTIESGTDVRQITEILQKEHVVRSASLLYYTLVFFYDPTSLKASSYVFEQPITTRMVAERLTQGDFDTDLIKFTHYEGESVAKLAVRADETLPNFDSTVFIQEATPYEGKLFPDTYFIPAGYTEKELLTLLLNTYDEKVVELSNKASSSTLSIDEVLVLASIVEREADTVESKKLVASVLLNRLELGMALQADASIEYVLDKPLSELTGEDLEIDSPYNTYLYPGLPPTPIGNPGLDAITAVLEPVQSDYYYYITDDAGEFHFAKTYNEHLRNIEVYLR